MTEHERERKKVVRNYVARCAQWHANYQPSDPEKRLIFDVIKQAHSPRQWVLSWVVEANSVWREMRKG